MKTFQIGIENGDENRSIAWMLDLPGCFAYGADQDAAFAAAPEAIRAYADWISSHPGAKPFEPGDFETRLDEVWNVYFINKNYAVVGDSPDAYAVNAWFRRDWKPLSEEDIHHGLKLLAWSREDLLSVIRDLPEDAQKRKVPGERWDIAGIVRHVAGAEWWYLDRLGMAFPRSDLAADTSSRLDQVRRHLLETLPGFAGLPKVVGVDGEFWSPRKLLRRAIWHERDHTSHIAKLLKRIDLL